MNKNFKTLTLQDAKRLLKKNGGSLYLSNTQLTALPDGLTVEGNLESPQYAHHCIAGGPYSGRIP